MEDFKLIVAGLLSPLWITILIQTTGLILLRTRRRALATRFFVAGFGVLVLGSLSGLTYERRRAAEFTHPPFVLREHDTATSGKTLICVLGTGFNPDPELPANSRVSGGFHGRLLEGVRLYRSLPDSRLLISVAGETAVEHKREFLDEMLDLLLLDPARVELVTEARSTVDEATEVSRRSAGEKVIVVTSAGHMPRAIATFEDAGLHPAAAPADYGFVRRGSARDKIWPRWIPSVDGIGSNHQWLYEKTASLWQMVRAL